MWLVRDLFFWEHPHTVPLDGAVGLAFFFVVVGGDVHAVVFGWRLGAVLMVVGRARVVLVGLPLSDAARGVELVWAEPLERGLQHEDLRESAVSVASTEEAVASVVAPNFAEVLRVMCVGVHACYQCISMSL